MTASLSPTSVIQPLATSGTNWELVFLVTIIAAVVLTIAWLALR